VTGVGARGETGTEPCCCPATALLVKAIHVGVVADGAQAFWDQEVRGVLIGLVLRGAASDPPELRPSPRTGALDPTAAVGRNQC
jgi:hypothetical protein